MKSNLFKKALKAVKSALGTNTRKRTVKVNVTAPVKVEPAENIFAEIRARIDNAAAEYAVTQDAQEVAVQDEIDNAKIYPIYDDDGTFIKFSRDIDYSVDNLAEVIAKLFELDDHDTNIIRACIELGWLEEDGDRLLFEVLIDGDVELEEGFYTWEDVGIYYFDEYEIRVPADCQKYFDLEKFGMDCAFKQDGEITSYGYLHNTYY